MHLPLVTFRPPRPKRWVRRLKVTGACMAAAFLSFWYIVPFSFPIPEKAIHGPAASTLILDRHGQPIHHSPRSDFYRHRSSSVDDIPKTLVDATLAAEDKRFFSHQGVDIRANLRAIKDSIVAGRYVSGASTITQQTIKLSSGSPARTLKNKCIEALMARHLEMVSDKPEILNAYFNHLDYGNLTQGPTQAALHYFGKYPDQLSLAEIAMLAGLPQAPSRLNPRRNPESALKRRNWVLDRMQEVFDYPSEQISRAKAEPIRLIPRQPATSDLQLSIMAMRHRSIGSSTVSTYLDNTLQGETRDIIRREINNLSEKNVQNGAAVVIDHSTGEVLALVGSADFGIKHGSQINAALAPRSPGSALKPFTYLLAIERLGLTPASILADVPTSYPGRLGEEAFINYERSYRGPVTMRSALGNSLNIPVIRTLNSLGGSEPLLDFLHQLGFHHLDDKPAVYGLSLTLGSGEVSLLEITNAYATLARSGIYLHPKIFLDQKNHQPTRLFSEKSAFLISSILRDNQARSHSFGHSSVLRLPFPCAVKTGTSSDFRDNFCVGFTHRYTVGVWIGNLDNSPMKGISGVSGAGPIFQKIMHTLHKDFYPQEPEAPEGIALVQVDPHTGKRLPPSHPRYQLAESCYCPSTAFPPFASPHDYNTEGKVRLDGIYLPWLTASPSPYFVAASEFDTHQPLRVLSPARDATYLLDPDLPDNGAYLALISNQPQNTRWSCSSLEIHNEQNRPTLHLREGTHELIATCPHTGQKQSITFHVKSL